MNKQPIFICGLNRTGTTTLGSLLNQSRELEFVREAWLLPQLKSLYTHYKKLHDDCDNFTPWSSNNVSLERFRSRLSEFYFALLMDASGGKRFVEKTPIWNVFRLKFLHSLFPNAYFILMYRDGRTQISSAMKKAENRNIELGFETCCRRWARGMEIFREVRAANSIQNLMFVQYEKLFKNPYRTFKDICRFVEIEPYNPYFPPANTSYNSKSQTALSSAKWETWSEQEKSIFNDIAGKQLRKWQYPIDEPQVTNLVR